MYSSISFEKVTFRRPGKSNNFSSGFVQAIVFEVEDRELIGGSAYGGQRAICCTADLAKLGVCSQGEIIHRPSTTNPGWPHVLSVSFIQNEDVATLPLRSVEISRTGMYNLYFMICDPALRDVVVEGKTIWKNPGGYLPGRMAPLMNFYAFMSIAYVILGIFWFSQYARFWKEVFPLQNCITVVITLGMFEMAFWYFDYAEFNETGIRPTGTTVWAVTFGTVKRTVARLIILIVSMGYGVVRPTLGGLTSKLYFKSHDVYNEHWQNAWVIPAFWQFLSFSLLCVICVLWAPSQNSMRYSYSDDASEEFDRDEASLRLIKPSSLPTKDVRAAPEPRSITTTNGASDENAEEEEKTA
ncbi:Transmembrane protein 87B [Linum perenne]